MEKASKQALRRMVATVKGMYEPGLPSLADDRTAHRTLDKCANHRAENAFLLLLSGHRDLGLVTAQRAVEAAEKALDEGDFYVSFYHGVVRDRDGVPVDVSKIEMPEKSVKVQHQLGLALTLEALLHGRWYLIGTLPDASTFRQSAEAWRQLYEMQRIGKQRFAPDTIRSLLNHLVTAGLHEQAIAAYQREWPKPITEPPTTKRFALVSAHVLYVTARFALGEVEHEWASRVGLEYWCEMATHWELSHMETTWPYRLNWAYLRARYYMGTTALADILDLLRT